MRNSKCLLAALAMAASFGFSVPAMAGYIPVPDMSFTEGSGDPHVAISDGTNSYPDVYIGTFNVTLSGGGSLNGQFIGFCDDFSDSIEPAPTVYTNTFNSTTLADVNNYLTGSGPTLTPTQVDEIIGLAFYGASNVNTLTGDQEAAIQEAIWDIQQEAESSSPAGLAASADAQILAADGYYADFLASGLTAIQLVTPDTGCPDATADNRTFNNGCQVQGLIVFRSPEPITLSLFGAGLVGAAVLRRRRKGAAKNVA